MLFWTVQTLIFSIIFIFLVHHLFVFFKSTLTVPKIKDLVNAPAQKYDDIYKVINNERPAKRLDEEDDYLPEKPDLDSMKNELKNFLKSKAVEGVTDISTLETPNYYAAY